MTSPTGIPRIDLSEHARTHPAPRAHRWARRATTTVTAATAGGVMLLGAPVLTDGAQPPASEVETTDTSVTLVSAAFRHRWPGHPGRWVFRHRVRPGDTVTRLAVRYHAWTRELLAFNHLGRRSVLYVGRVLRVPVVLAAVPHHHARHHKARHRKAHHHKAGRHKARRHKARHHHTARHHHKARHHKARHHHHKARHSKARHHHARHHHARHPWRQAYASRAHVRRLVARTARAHHVNPHAMLAISWQESGWQQHHRSSAGAIGAMQIMPATGQWLSLYLGRHLNIYALRDNVLAGVVLFRVLRGMASFRRSIGGYYQGLRSIRHRGMYPSTRRYVRNVVAIAHSLDRGRGPA